MNTSYTKAEHAQLQEQVARYIRRMMQPDAAAWETPAWCRVPCYTAWAVLVCRGWQSALGTAAARSK